MAVAVGPDRPLFRDVCGGARLHARNGTEGEKLWMTRKKT